MVIFLSVTQLVWKAVYLRSISLTNKSSLPGLGDDFIPSIAFAKKLYHRRTTTLLAFRCAYMPAIDYSLRQFSKSVKFQPIRYSTTSGQELCDHTNKMVKSATGLERLAIVG